MHVHPAGLTQHLAQSRWSLPVDMALTIVLLSTFMTRWRQTHELAHLSSPTKPSRTSNLGAVDHCRHQSDAGLLSQLIHDRFVSGLAGQLLDGFFNTVD